MLKQNINLLNEVLIKEISAVILILSDLISVKCRFWAEAAIEKSDAAERQKNAAKKRRKRARIAAYTDERGRPVPVI